MALKIERDLTDGRVLPMGEQPPPPDGQAEKVLETLARLIADYLRAGRPGTWMEWMAQGPEFRAVAVQVGEHVEEERQRALAALIGLAMGGQPAHIAAVLEDDETAARVAEEEIVRRLARGGNHAEGY